MRRAGLSERRALGGSSLLPPGPVGAPASAVTALDPLTIFSGTKIFFFSGSVGFTPSRWIDQSAAGHDAVQATAGLQPTAQVAALNGRDTVRFDGIDDCMVIDTWDPPAPGTTPSFFWGVIKQISWTSADSVYCGNNASRLRLLQSTSSPNLVGTNGIGSSLNNGAAIGSWVRLEHLFNNSTTDYLKLGSVSVTGISQANGDPAANVFTIGAEVTSGALAWNGEFACLMGITSAPSAGELAAADAWVTAFYGAGVGI